jgi:hypothetical protein
VQGPKLQIQECKLCLQQKALCNSHIIPEFCYEPLYDRKRHNFIELNISENRLTKPQKGYREKLFCSECETVLNRYERHMRRLFVDPLPAPRKGTTRVFDYSNLDYNFTKLYAMSLAWRASVSSLDICKHVDLGPYNEEFRSSILTGNVPSKNRFACTIFRILWDNEHFQDFMINPTPMKIEGFTCHRFLLRGFLFLVYGSPKAPKEQEVLFIEPGKVFVMNAEFREFKFLSKTWEAGAACKLPEDL